MNVILSYCTNSLQSISFLHIFIYTLYVLVVHCFEHFHVTALYKLNIFIIIIEIHWLLKLIICTIIFASKLSQSSVDS